LKEKDYGENQLTNKYMSHNQNDIWNENLKELEEIRNYEKKCSQCDNPATRKTVKGSWYCKKCWEEGEEEEKVAMGHYDYPHYN